jgi:hypothetical protein
MEIPLPLAPLVVGVTGHRDLREEDVEQLEQVVGRVLDEFLRRSPATPLMILSPLAEGADRLVARVALRRDARLVVVLPMEETLYKETFKDQKSIDEFQELREDAESVVVISHTPCPDDLTRKRQYALAGACVARYSEILLALWDGEQEVDTGGTGQVVRFYTTGRFQDADLQRAFEALEEPFGSSTDPLTPPERGLIVHIVTPRDRCPQPRQAFDITHIIPIGQEAKQFFRTFDSTCDRRNDFNRDLKRRWRATEKCRSKELKSLPVENESDPRLKVLLSLREQYAAADALASYFQRWTNITVYLLGALVFVASIAFAYHSTLAPPEARRNPWSLALYLVLLAIAGGVHSLAEHWKFHSKFLDYRAVAEGLRVQFFWCLGGVRKSTADHYLRWQQSELEWIRHVLRPWALPLTALQPMLSQHKNENLLLVRQLWIERQADYFKATAPEKSHLLLRLTAIRNTLLLSSLVLAVVEVFHQPESFQLAKVLVAIASIGAVIRLFCKLVELWHGIGLQPSSKVTYRILARGVLEAILGLLVMGATLWGVWCLRTRFSLTTLDRTEDAWRMVAMGLAAVAGALIYGYAETMALPDESKQYERMARLFDSAVQKPVADPYLLEALGKEALAENGEWVLMHRERPVELPT